MIDFFNFAWYIYLIIGIIITEIIFVLIMKYYKKEYYETWFSHVLEWKFFSILASITIITFLIIILQGITYLFKDKTAQKYFIYGLGIIILIALWITANYLIGKYLGEKLLKSKKKSRKNGKKNC